MTCVPRSPFFMLLVVLVCLGHGGGASGARVTFHRDVEPILLGNCAECHRPGQCAPFNLLSYEDAARHARQIALVTRKRFMPPWKADDGEVKYQNCRRLTNAQIAILERWVEGGTAEGNTVGRPTTPWRSDSWPSGGPDQIVTLQTPFPIAADGPDIYHRFVLRLNLPRDRWIRMAVFRPNNPPIARMAMLSLDTTGLARRMAARSEGSGYTSMLGQVVPTADNFGEWAPGVPPYPLPAGVGILARKGADLVVLVRLHPDGKAEREQFQVGLYFARELPQTTPVTIALGAANLYIRPGETNRVVTDTFELPVPILAFRILAHAHLLCRRIKAVALLPNGVKRTLLSISDWNVNWQLPYTFAKPVWLPAGTRLIMEAAYDNTSPPPPGTVFNATVTEEMAYLQVQATPQRRGDITKLRLAILAKQQRSRRQQSN